VRTAVSAGSNVIVSAEESAYPWAVDDAYARDIDTLARQFGVTVVGAGVNPGFIVDALVLTLLGTTSSPTALDVSRTVDISGFGAVVLGRLGVGVSPDEFAAGVSGGQILGHAGFPQSMAIVADAQGLHIDRIDRRIDPIIATAPIDLRQMQIRSGDTAGVRQTYTAIVAGSPWFTAKFLGHVDLTGAGFEPRDEITLTGEASQMTCVLAPGIGAQAGSAAMVANSVDRVIAASPGWLTVADLPPAFFSADPATAGHRQATV
jgi:hypothetical protein